MRGGRKVQRRAARLAAEARGVGAGSRVLSALDRRGLVLGTSAARGVPVARVRWDSGHEGSINILLIRPEQGGE